MSHGARRNESGGISVFTPYCSISPLSLVPMQTMIAATGGAVLPLVIQGGMGTGVSNWTLANAVSRIGQLGVVSGTVLDTILVRRLQDGDIGGHVRRAMEHFPMPEVSETVLRRYFLPDGRPPLQPYKLLPMYRQVVSTARQQITMLANFVEVYLAKEGHSNPVGINLLTKVQMPNLASLYGAMLAGVDYVLMGAGIPREIPGVLDAFSEHRPASLKLDVDDMPPGESEYITLDPSDYWEKLPPSLPRPRFLPIISANSLATSLARKSTGRIDGFVVEGPTAGGHNAPPRGAMQLDASGQPIYGDRDAVDLDKLAELGLPFWLAGGTGSPEGVRDALAAGAAGVQVGTLFAYCDESGFTPEIKRRTLEGVLRGEVEVYTDPLASPTGYPFKVVNVEGMERQDDRRTRNCDLGYLRTAARSENGRLVYRCASEPVDTYLKKGGKLEDTVGRRCLCNALVANIGHGQERHDDGGTELPLLTSGDDLVAMGRFLAGRTSYTAADVIDYLCSLVPQRADLPLAAAASA